MAYKTAELDSCEKAEFLRDSSDDDSQEEAFFNGSGYRQTAKTSSRKQTIFLYVSLALNLLFVAFWAGRSIYLHEQSHDAVKTKHSSSVLAQIPVETSMKRRDGSFLPGKSASLFRQGPSDEVDSEWDRIENINQIAITAEDVTNAGYDPAQVAKWPREYGLGDDAYVARIDIFHQIHCLNMIRKEAHADYYFKDKFKSGTREHYLHKEHVDHCIYTILQSLTCTASTNPFIHWWTDSSEEMYPDFSINRQCRDFDAILNWQENNNVPMSKVRNVIKTPEDAYVRKMSLEYKYRMNYIQIDPAVDLAGARLQEEAYLDLRYKYRMNYIHTDPANNLTAARLESAQFLKDKGKPTNSL